MNEQVLSRLLAKLIDDMAELDVEKQDDAAPKEMSIEVMPEDSEELIDDETLPAEEDMPEIAEDESLDDETLPSADDEELEDELPAKKRFQKLMR